MVSTCPPPGFEHNAVTPLGMVEKMPIVISSPIQDIPAGSNLARRG